MYSASDIGQGAMESFKIMVEETYRKLEQSIPLIKMALHSRSISKKLNLHDLNLIVEELGRPPHNLGCSTCVFEMLNVLDIAYEDERRRRVL